MANYFLWFYALGAGLINAIAHFVFPLVEGGYFPGLRLRSQPMTRPTSAA